MAVGGFQIAETVIGIAVRRGSVGSGLELTLGIVGIGDFRLAVLALYAAQFVGLYIPRFVVAIIEWIAVFQSGACEGLHLGSCLGIGDILVDICPVLVFVMF